MSRLDSLPDERLSATLDKVSATLHDLKTSAQITGSASLQGVPFDSGAAYDWSGKLNQDPQAPSGYGALSLEVTLTAANMDNLFGQLYAYLYVGTSTNWYRPSNYIYDVGLFNPAIKPWLCNVTDGSVPVANRKQKRWLVYLNGDTTKTVYLKFYGNVSDSASISIQVLS